MKATGSIWFRTDASLKIGTGHVMRCLTLADAFLRRGYSCHFICRAHRANLANFIRKKGHSVHLLKDVQAKQAHDARDELNADYTTWLGTDWQTDADQCVSEIGNSRVDWLIVDHYGLDERWEQRLQKFCNNIMVIDDLADRSHHCNLLLDQTFGRHPQEYESKTPTGCNILCGSRYALLRPEFKAWRPYSLGRRMQQRQLHRLLVTMGGIDKDNITGRVLRNLCQNALPHGCVITVVMGKDAPWLQAVQEEAEAMQQSTTVVSGVSNMAKLMSASDFAIGAAGATTWERCCLGLPSTTIVLAENQELIAKNVSEAGGAVAASIPLDNDPNPLLDMSVFDADHLLHMSNRAADIADGHGVRRVLSGLISNQA